MTGRMKCVCLKSLVRKAPPWHEYDLSPTLPLEGRGPFCQSSFFIRLMIIHFF
jgi:hypothetical protein